LRSHPFLLLGVLLVTTQVQAQQGYIVDADLTNELHESYDPAEVSGSPLVGLRIGSVGGKLRPESLIVVRPNSPGGTICVRATTQDGRYSASNAYRIKEDNPKAVFARLSPITMEYGDILADYENDEFAVRAYATRAENCSPTKPMHLPLLADESLAAPTASRSELVVFANGRSQIGRATLHARGEAGKGMASEVLDSADCVRAGASSLIAYDLTCRLDLSGDAVGPVVLVLEFNDGFGITEYHFDVYLPELVP
jgi:hypothetical protein